MISYLNIFILSSLSEQVAGCWVKLENNEIKVEKAKSSMKLWPSDWQSQLNWAVQIRLAALSPRFAVEPKAVAEVLVPMHAKAPPGRRLIQLDPAPGCLELVRRST